MAEIDDREIPRSVRAYLASFQETANIGRWVWKEVMTPESIVIARKMLLWVLVMTLFQAIQPGFIGMILNGLNSHRAATIFAGFACMVLCMAAQKTAHYFQQVTREVLLGMNWARLDHRLTELLFEKSMGQFLRESTLLSVSNIDKGRWRTLDLMNLILFEAMPSLFMLLLSYIAIWFISPVAGVIMSSVIMVHLAWSLFLNQRVVAVCTPIDARFRALNRHRLERWEKMERVKTVGKERAELKEMFDRFAQYIGEDCGFWVWFIQHGTAREAINAVGAVAAMSYGTYLAWHGDYSIGMMYPLFAWVLRLSENIWRIGSIEHQLNWNMPAVKSMMKAVTLPSDLAISENPVVIPPVLREGIVFSKISHFYQPSMHEVAKRTSERASGKYPVLKNVDFTIAPGERVALVGPSGAGKTTLMRLLLRFMDPSEGKILVDGHDLRNIDLESWSRQIGYIAQQPQILDGTVRYNLTYGLSSEEAARIQDAELWELMRLLQIDFGERLIDGLDTVVGRNGVKLSGGQGQRLMIGAAMVKNPPYLIIDEATSSLDSTTEKAVQRGLEECMRGREITALVVAHRLSTVRTMCTKFVLLRETNAMQNGHPQVEAIGSSFEELATLSPSFRQLLLNQEIYL